MFYGSHWIISESDEEQILKNELKRNKDVSPKILGDGDFDRVVQIWLPIDSNNLFNPSHYYWQDRPFFKYIIQNVKYDLFIANFRLAQDNLSIDRSAAGLYANKAFEVIDQISLCSPYSIKGASSTRLAPEDAHFRNLDYKDMMKNTFTWLERWGIESLEGLYGIPKLKLEALLHRAESRLQELDFLINLYKKRKP